MFITTTSLKGLKKVLSNDVKVADETIDTIIADYDSQTVSENLRRYYNVTTITKGKDIVYITDCFSFEKSIQYVYNTASGELVDKINSSDRI